MVECPADWKYCAIGKLACLKAGNDHFETSQCDGIYPWYGGNGVRGYSSCFTYDGLFPIVGRQGELCGNVKLAKGRFSATEHAVVVACGPEVLPNYFYYSLTFANLNQYATGCAQPGLSVQKICGVQILTPSLPEQRRIAAALGDMDKLIDNLSKRIEKKKAIKQGAMQELLTGKRRLPGFSGEWKKVSISSVATLFTDGDWIESIDQSETGIRLVQTGNIGCGSFKNKGDKKHYITDATFKRLNCTEIFEGDVLISRLPDPIGRSCLVPKTHERLITAVDCTIVRFGDYSAEFFVQYTQTPDYLARVESFMGGSTRQRISREALGHVAIPYPPLPEQRAIAKLLSDMDAEIGKLETKREKLLGIKKGMMSDLLTGKVRLK